MEEYQNTYQIQHSLKIGAEYLDKLTLPQRIIRLLYLKYVYEPERAALMAEIPRLIEKEQAMIEKIYYEQSNHLH